MHLLKEGRVPLLEFLRNITPQTVFLALAFLIARKLDFGRIDWSNSAPTAAFFVFLGIWLIATYANISLFLERTLGSYKPISDESKRLRENGFAPIEHLNWVMIYTIKNHPWFFVELCFLAVLLEGALAFTLFNAISTAASITKILR